MNIDLTTLFDAVQADPALAALQASGDHTATAAACNALTDTDLTRTRIPLSDVSKALTQEDLDKLDSTALAAIVGFLSPNRGAASVTSDDLRPLQALLNGTASRDQLEALKTRKATLAETWFGEDALINDQDIGQAFAAYNEARRMQAEPGEKTAEAALKRDIQQQATAALALDTLVDKLAALEIIKPLLDADMRAALDTLPDNQKLALLEALPAQMVSEAVKLDKAAADAQAKVDAAADRAEGVIQ